MESDTENHIPLTDALSFKIASTPSTPQPLQAISSERQNQQRLPQSPGLPFALDGNGSPRKSCHHRDSDAADVKARIAYLNSISHNGSPTRSPSPTKSHMSTLSHAAIQRAILGREEAESTLASLTTQLESAKARERLVSERVESLMEQLTEVRNRQRHERLVYEKEIKTSKKTEYKAELAVIKLQEELREAKSEIENHRVRSEHEKVEKDKARQEAFERAYVVAGMTEELQELKRKLEITEQERDAAVAMAASKMPLEQEITQKNTRQGEEMGEKRKQPTADLDPFFYDEVDLEAPDCPIEIKYAASQQVIRFLRDQVTDGRETIDFMLMQCQFKACPCRNAERDGVRFVHDYEYDAKVREKNAKRRKLEGLPPELPLPVFKSFLQKQEEAESEAKGKHAMRQDVSPAQESAMQAQEESDGQLNEPFYQQVAAQEPEQVVEESAAPLPPTPIESERLQVEQNAVLEEAANVPLPALKPMEIDAADDTPEPTALLEEMTQVIVGPGNSAEHFVFSTSTTSNKVLPESVPTLRQSYNVRMSDDLFDISPPKKHIPPRPSTAMGVLTIESPIRLVPQSPQHFEQRSMTPETDLPRPLTTRVALNDTSPVRQSRQQRQQLRPHIRDQLRGRSPAPLRRTDFERSSPAPSTVFPITPAIKQERVIQTYPEIQARPQTTQGYYSAPVRETSTTTTVPLRDNSENSNENRSSSGEHLSEGTPFSVPGTPNITREQALAQIRARRDRARSINMRKSAEEGSKTPGSAARRGVNLKERMGDTKARDFSQASAPGRM